MESLKRVLVNEDALRNFREQTRLSAAKDHVIHAALNDAARQIVANYSPNISLDASKASLTEIRQGVFSGKVEAQLSVETGTGIKRIAYPIEVRASKAVLDNDLNIKAKISAALAKTASDLDVKAEEYAKEFDKKAEEILQAQEDEKQITALMDKEDLSLEAATAKVFNLNAALKAEAKFDKLVDTGMDNQSNIGINTCPQAFIEVDKNNLPASYAVGDALDVNGIPYVCVEIGPAFIKFKINMK